MNRTVRRAAQGLRKRNEFDDLLQIYAEDKGTITVGQRLALNSLSSFEEGQRVTAELGGHYAHRQAVAQAQQSPPVPNNMPGDASKLIFPPSFSSQPPPPPDDPMDGRPPGGGGVPEFPPRRWWLPPECRGQ